MKIVLAHNFYGSSAPSGENAVFLAERELLSQHGHEVIDFVRHSDDIRGSGVAGLVKGACSTPWNPFSKAALRQVLKKQKPDVLHVHNTFPLLSPSIFHAPHNFHTAVVLTLHNYRVFCAAGIPMRNSLPCTECLDKKSVLPALNYGCYRNRLAATVPMALMIALHRWLGTWQTQVDAFITLTGFQKEKMIGAGLPEDRVYIKPHFYPNPPFPFPWQERESRIVYIGRLGNEKGVHVLIDAWKHWGTAAPHLDLVGDGPEKETFQKLAGGTDIADKIRFLGQLPYNETQDILARASMLILPSLCFEGFPMVIREAFALGVPVAASRLGAMADIVEDWKTGVLFTPGDAGDILRKVRGVWEKPERLAEMAVNARRVFEEKYTSVRNYEMLMGIYQQARERRNKCV
ncbi:MAG: glycosyltransferase family 4 protein [Desulfococcus multivorans]|jgi:glycosyltransferase involved in cell wall biosynthesis|nr:glycosyltransferase family 4 protein [Desulfococcus multivorans]